MLFIYKRQSKNNFSVHNEIKKRPLLQDVADPRAVLEELAKVRNPLYEEIADFILPTDEQSAKIMANQIVDLIENAHG